MGVPKSIIQVMRMVSVFVLGALTAFSAWADHGEIKLQDGFSVEHYLYKPSKKGVYPAVIVQHTRGGLKEFEKEFARELSSENYVTIVVNWQTGTAWPDEKVGAVYDHLRKLPFVEPDRIGMVGFSRGAFNAMKMAIDWHKDRPVRAVVSYYMGRGVYDQEPELPPILFLHGDGDIETVADQVVAACEKLKKMGNVCEAKIYKNTRHAFTHKSRYGPYDHRTTVDAFKRAVAFLNKYLRNAPIQ